ncbi:ketopantoate reductase PanE/ApbA family protein [Neocallimastix lanati (nom. inval.)]|jgi:2-dehydropantoate 2-reductase|uniref:Ketopantoate reductase PanE/ApbA family protein n=1 Tax=Neocallimastix californiae TaxID=1754190 RepID=A0A1Y2DKW8_9FUNG|nr:ketopantoate reductase PanE/ApbA family protein [Neocallimastix sp. JGI-2020a]ORY59776.1 ketopantoate reductase PanE/ApbA family protein [Neocallimastix californiae]|eukprot:ORY59776.1 ketopantoate reductase PanE/ApbA family protein [Neocallimastix californiae]
MKILILGRGVIGIQYGWALENAGNTVDFYVRKSNKHNYADYVELHTYDGRKKQMINEKWSVNLRYEIPNDEKYDLIIISVNPEQVSGAIETITPIVGDANVLIIGNYGGNPVNKIQTLPHDQIIIGFPGAGGGITDNVLHGVMYPSIEMGMSGEKISEREQKIKQLFESADFKVSMHTDIGSWLLNHYVLNAAMETEVLKRGSFEAVISSDNGLVDMLLNAREMVPYLKAKGVKLDIVLKVMGIVPASLIAYLMKKTVYKPGSPGYNAIAYNKYEVGYSVREIVEDAKALGVSLPRIEDALK